MKKVYGEYCEKEYTVYLDGEEIYHAGNHPHDSTLFVDSSEGLDLQAMHDNCRSTSLDIAEENNAEYLGVNQIPQDEE